MLVKLKKLKLMSWNCRGLGSIEKSEVVRNVIRHSRCDVCLLQETKLNESNLNYYSCALPSFFEKQAVMLYADGSKGGLIITWKRSFQLLNSWTTRNSCSALLKQTSSGGILLITNVYGPSSDDIKPEFIQEVRSLASMVRHPWILGGDFNLVRWLTDRSGMRSCFNLMAQFNDAIRDLELIDVPLSNRRYTWSSKRPVPTHSKLDRLFITPEISLHFPKISLQALEVLVSDHVPLLMNCSSGSSKRKPFKLELFWLANPKAREIIGSTWREENITMGHGVQRFQENTKLMHERLRSWHCQNFTQLESQLQCCRETIMFFDHIEEERQLQEYEFRFRIQVRERAYLLAGISESRWAHRARCRWLKAGDRNTRFFHALASSRQRRNTITNLTHEGQEITGDEEIRRVFRDHMLSILGSENSALRFDSMALYPHNPDLSFLGQPFTQVEIEVAVTQLASNKASGPDGLPNEFLKMHWNSIKDDVFTMVQAFYDHRLDLAPINRANIILIQKKETPRRVEDYRPISVINAVPKLISKILANRLRGVLSDLISPCQTAFVQGRQISDNFNATREILHHLAKTGNPIMFVKIDFAKAFDSVNWMFLFDIMQSRGFPDNWIKWIRDILTTASSRVLVNGEESTYFKHKKGLRQGDPLSPMLFDLAADVFQRFIEVLNGSVSASLSNRLDKAVIAHQYADDTALISCTDVNTVVTLKTMMRLFTSVSGLEINYNKSTWIPINVDDRFTPIISQLLGCSISAFPISYLGLPLTINKPTRALYMPLIEKIESRLEGWKGKLISRAGRLQLMNSVLSSIPIYFMASFLLPKWVVDRIDKIRRDFLWRQSEDRRGISLLNWDAVCLPKENGGLGGANLKLRNWALLLRWWWRLYKQPDSMWGQTIIAIRSFPQLPRIWIQQGSFFWMQLLRLKPLFNRCTRWVIGLGTEISYWFDPWMQPTMDQLAEPQPHNRRWSLRESCQRGQSLPIQFNNDQDRLTWELSITGIYSAKSCYHSLVRIGKTEWQFDYTWRLKIPPTVQLFAFLLLKGKILTHDVLLRRGISCDLRCVTCQFCRFETAMHLMFQCEYAARMWRCLAAMVGCRLLYMGHDTRTTFTSSWNQCRGTLTRKKWGVLFLAGCWHLWLERNQRVFHGKSKDARWVADRALMVSRMWLQHCV